MFAGWITSGYEKSKLVANKTLITQVNQLFGGRASVMSGVYNLFSPKANTQIKGKETYRSPIKTSVIVKILKY